MSGPARMESSGVTVKIATYRHEAELLVMTLEAAGITAWLVDQHLVGADPLMSNAVGGIKVNVREADREQATLVLADVAGQRPSTDGCLSCGAPMAENVSSCAACGWSYLT